MSMEMLIRGIIGSRIQYHGDSHRHGKDYSGSECATRSRTDTNRVDKRAILVQYSNLV